MKRHFRTIRLLAGSLVLYAALHASSLFGLPVVGIFAPFEGSVYPTGTVVPVQLTAYDADGLIEVADIFLNGELIIRYVWDDNNESWKVLEGPWPNATPVGDIPFRTDVQLPSAGVYTLQASVLSSTGETALSDPVTVEAAELEAGPFLNILAPVTGSSFLPGTLLPVQVQAHDPGGLIQQVEFLLNDVVVGVVTAAPFRTEVQLPSIGSYVLTARSTTNTGVQAFSQEVLIEAGPPDEVSPRVVIDFPLPLGAGDTVNDVSYASSMFLNATVVDPDGGSIESVNFYINGQLLGSAESNLGDVYAMYYDPNAQGNYVLLAQAMDNDGNVGWSLPLNLDVGPLERPLPSAEMIQPFPESILGRVVGIFVEATGGLIQIDRVDFFANGIYLGSSNEPVVDDLYSFNWVPEQAGDYALQARVVQIDPEGAAWDNWKIADPVSITIAEPPAGELPSVALINPTETQSHTVLNPIALQAEAIDPLGSILAVRFYANGRQVGEVDTLYPYTMAYVPASPGQYQFVAEMESDRGFRIQSSPVTVNVLDSQLPTAAITHPFEGAAVSVGTPILVTATTGSTGGNQMILDFYANGVFVGSDDTFPFSQLWAPQSTGQYALKVVAREPGTAEGVATSEEVRITVNPTALPTASITKPSGPNPTVGSDVQIEVEAADADGFVSSVDFFVNGFVVGGTDLEKPFSTFWRPGSPGQYTLSALVTDNSGNQVITSKVVTVSDTVGVVPRVTLSVTGSGNVTPGSRVVVRASVFDDDPRDVSVTFFMNGDLLGTDVQAPFSIIVDPEVGFANSAYELTAVASDRDGNSRADNLFPLYISDFTVDQPSIEIISVSEGDNLTLGSRVPIRVDVQGGAASTIANIVFYADGIEIGRIRGNEDSFDWVPDRTGPVELTAATLLTTEFYDHDDDFDTPRIPVTPVNVASPVNVVVNEAIGILPSISLDVLPSRENLAIGSKVLVYANAQDLDGQVEQVEFFVDGVSAGVDGAAPFTYTLTTARQGTFPLNALATDSDGNVVTSTFINIVVADRVVTRTPEISLTVPDSGQEGNWLSLRASTEGFVTAPEAVAFYVNGQYVGESSDLPYVYPWLANLEGTLAFFATARQVLGDGSVVSTVSEIVQSFLVDNLPPVIGGFTVTYPDADLVSKPNPVLGDALNFTVQMSDSSPIKTAELLRDGDVVQTLQNPASPFEFTDFPPSVGQYGYTVVVTDRGALQTQSDPLSIAVAERPGGGGGGGEPTLPEILSFRSDLAGNSSLVNLPLTLTVEARDAEGIERVEVFQDGALIATVYTEPYSVEFLPVAAGNYNFRARVTNLQGNQVNSDGITITVRQPDPLNQNTDFVYQTFLDLLMRTPLLEERNAYTNRIESGDLTRDRFIRELIQPGAGQELSEYDAVRAVLLANWFLFADWPARSDLVSQVGAVKDGGIEPLVVSLMPAFESRYVEAVGGAVSGVPDIISAEVDIETFIQFMFGAKYGVLPTASQLNLAKLHFRANGRDGFVAKFIQDTQVVATSSGFLTLGLGFKFDLAAAPSDSYLRQADAASLLINLLRISPSVEEVSALSGKLFAAQVADILADPRYSQRFQTAFATLEHYADGWKRSEWFGWFNTAYEPWVYHAEQGWISFNTVGQSESNFWYYDAALGWMWTHADLFPVLYNNVEGSWLLTPRLPFSVAEGRWFFDFGAASWIKR